MPGDSGQSFGKYVLLDRIAAGGMAEIFRAHFLAAAGITKSVVIKRILPHYAGNRAFVSMFINEAKIAVGLSHGNIAQVFDFGEVDGEFYLAMEYVPGQSISRLHKRARALSFDIPVPVAAWVISEVCSGLHYAHSRADEQGRPLGIVHRDVSPQNLIVSFEGEVKLVDFGIAKARLETEELTEHGALKGKYIYFSPEQSRGLPLDGRSDIFAAGICLYELLTNRLPFEGKMLDVLGKIARGEFDPPSRHNPRIGPELEQIILKAMSQRAGDRFQTALEMNEALTHYLHSAWPRFSKTQVANFAQYLSRDELEQDGLPVKLPEGFLTWLQDWKTDSGIGGGSRYKSQPGSRGGHPTTADRLMVMREREPAAEPMEIHTDDLIPEPSRARASGWLSDPKKLAGVAVLAVVAVVAAVFLLASPAQVKPNEPALRLEAPGAAGQSGMSDVEERIAGPVSLPGMPLELDARTHAVNVLASRAARMRLDPSKSYRLTVEGAAQLRTPGGGERTLRSVLFFGERATGTAAEGSFGRVSPDEAITVAGMRALYGFILDETPEANSGALKLAVHEVKTRAGSTLLVDPAQHVVRPSTLSLPRFEGLKAGKFWLTLSGGADLGAGGGMTQSVLYFRRNPLSGETGQGLLTAAAPVRIEGGGEVMLLLPDDDAHDNQGQLTARLEAAAE